MVAPETGCCPPCTTPDICEVVVHAVDGEFQLPSEQPDRNTLRKQNKEAEMLRLDTVDTSRSEIRTLRGPVDKIS
jgi:hypothetical protein